MASERHERQAKIMKLFKEAGYLDGDGMLQMAISLDKVNEEELTAMEGFIDYCKDNKHRIGYITSNLGHDIHGIAHFRAKPDEGFTPRTRSYAEFKKEVTPCLTGATQE